MCILPRGRVFQREILYKGKKGVIKIYFHFDILTGYTYIISVRENGNMKANKKFIEGEEEAVSAVIGVILMVAITVAIAATVYVYVSGMIGGTASKSSILSMNIYSRNDAANETIWLVSGIEGEAVEDGTYQTALLFANGTLDSGATITKQEVVGSGYVNSGDTLKVTASEDGYFVFMITDTATGQTIYKSTSSKY